MINPQNSFYSSKQAEILEKDEIRDRIRHFADLFSNFSEQTIEDKLDSVYSYDAYLNDSVKEHYGLEAIRGYLINASKAANNSNFRIEKVTKSGNDYYVQWTMEIHYMSLYQKQVCRTKGISHLRFNPRNLVTYHRDYWNSNYGFYQYVPKVS